MKEIIILETRGKIAATERTGRNSKKDTTAKGTGFNCKVNIFNFFLHFKIYNIVF